MKIGPALKEKIMPRTVWVPLLIAVLLFAGGLMAQSVSDAKLARSVGHQIGALHDVSYYNDRNGAIQNLQNISSP